jgi:hypothetical protein
LFTQKEASNDAIYQINLFKRGQQIPITIDNTFPTFNSEAYKLREVNAMASINIFKTLWPSLVEKAYAKLFVNYAQLSYGWAYESIRTLTSMPY